MKLPVLETKRLILKEVTMADVPAYEKYFVDYEVIRNLAAAVPWPYPADGVRKFVQDYIIPNQGDDQWVWGLFLKSNPSELIGVVDLWREPDPANRGFWLGRPFWKQGLMTEAATAVLDYAFEHLNFEKMFFCNAVGNDGSHRVKQKTGARLLEVRPGKYVDPKLTQQELWELTQEDWKKFRKEKS